MTLADGYSSAKSIAQIPVPVPRSSTFWLRSALVLVDNGQAFT